MAYANHMMEDWLVAAAIQQRRHYSTYFVHESLRGETGLGVELVEIPQARHRAVLGLSGEPVKREVPIKYTAHFTMAPLNPNQSSAWTVKDNNRFNG